MPTSPDPRAALAGDLGPVLGEGSVFEQLRRRPGIAFDATVGIGGLPLDPDGREALRSVHGAYLDAAADAGLVALLLTDTWRASAPRIAASPFAGADLNAAGVALLREVAAARLDARALVGGLLGPLGDAYDPAAAPGTAEAAAAHAPQAAALAAAGADLLVAQTLPALGEALGLAQAMAATGLPYVVSLVIRPDGTVLDGTPLGAAADALAALPVPPATLMANCVHPSVLDAALDAEPAVVGRLTALQGNTAALAPERLDGSAELIGAEPEAFADLLVDVARRRGLVVVGGCCGTDARHIRALAHRLAAG